MCSHIELIMETTYEWSPAIVVAVYCNNTLACWRKLIIFESIPGNFDSKLKTATSWHKNLKFGEVNHI